MDLLGNFLEKYSHLTPPEGSKKKVFIEVVSRECGITLKEKNITFTNGGVFLSCHPIIKKEIISQGSDILQRMREDFNIHATFIK
jgi:hypothetical protein